MQDEKNAASCPSLAGASWLHTDAIRSVFTALSAAGFEARAVGGAVRNALLGEPVRDIDIATTARPEDVMSITDRNGLKAIPTGIEHGTVTVIANHVPFEVTTLRRDVETFGRHARVTFTADWTEDARRRDFTINALYCGADGTVHDPLGGYGDIKSRRVRFIGDANDRIREDYLRILRFFRFSAQYSAGSCDPVGVAACAGMKAGLTGLSGERVRSELMRLLAAPHAAAVASEMHGAGILSLVLGGDGDTSSLERLTQIERSAAWPPDPLLRLGVLALRRPGAALQLKETLKLSSQEYERLAGMAMPDPAFDPGKPEHAAQAFIYRHGTQRFLDGFVLAWARSQAAPDDPARLARLTLPHRFKVPELPVRGSDVLALGVPAGPSIGRVLSQFEDWWIAEGFPSDAARLAAELHRLAMVTKT